MSETVYQSSTPAQRAYLRGQAEAALARARSCGQPEAPWTAVIAELDADAARPPAPPSTPAPPRAPSSRHDDAAYVAAQLSDAGFPVPADVAALAAQPSSSTASPSVNAGASPLGEAALARMTDAQLRAHVDRVLEHNRGLLASSTVTAQDALTAARRLVEDPNEPAHVRWGAGLAVKSLERQLGVAPSAPAPSSPPGRPVSNAGSGTAARSRRRFVSSFEKTGGDADRFPRPGPGVPTARFGGNSSPGRAHLVDLRETRLLPPGGLTQQRVDGALGLAQEVFGRERVEGFARAYLAVKA